MNCSHSMAPNEEELLRYALDDEPLKMGTEEHLAQCPLCQQRLAAYKQTNAFLISRLYRSQCPDATQLNHYCVNMLSIEDRFLITDHLKACPLCAAEVLDIRHFLADFDPFPAPAPLSAPVHAIKQLLASLIPWQPQMVTRQVPSEAQGSSWPRQYRADSLNISLHLSRNSDGEMILLGLFSSTSPDESIEDLEGVPVELHRAKTSVAGHDRTDPQMEELQQETLLMCTSIDDLGNIVFKPVPVGEYTLIVHLSDSDLNMKGLTIERN
jgi:hypothetical protein